MKQLPIAFVLCSGLLLSFCSRLAVVTNKKTEGDKESLDETLKKRNEENSLDINNRFKPSHQYVSQYNWKSIESVPVPSFVGNVSDQSLGLVNTANDGVTNKCRINSNATEFVNSFKRATEKTVRPPDRTLCNSKEIEVGRIYSEERGGQPSYSVERFIEKDGSLYHLFCRADSRELISLAGYRLEDDTKFKVESWAMTEQGEVSHYDLFSRFINNPDLIEIKRVSGGDYRNDSFSASYTASGEGSSTYSSSSSNYTDFNRIFFTNEGGVFESHSSNVGQGESQSWDHASIFDANKNDISRLAATDAVYQMFLDNRNSNESYVAGEIAVIDPELNCFGQLDVISCPSVPEIGTDAGGDASQGLDSPCDSGAHADDDQTRYRPQAFADASEKRDSYSLMQVSIKGRDRQPAVGEVFGLTAYTINPDNSKTEVLNLLELKLGSNFEKISPECGDVSDATEQLVSGVAFSDEEICILKKDWPILVKVLSSEDGNGDIELSGRNLTAKISIKAVPWHPYRLVMLDRSIKDPDYSAVCSNGGLINGSSIERSSEVLLTRSSSNPNASAVLVYECRTDGSISLAEMVRYRLVKEQGDFSANRGGPSEIVFFGALENAILSLANDKGEPRAYSFKETFKFTVERLPVDDK